MSPCRYFFPQKAKQRLRFAVCSPKGGTNNNKVVVPLRGGTEGRDKLLFCPLGATKGRDKLLPVGQRQLRFCSLRFTPEGYNKEQRQLCFCSLFIVFVVFCALCCPILYVAPLERSLTTFSLRCCPEGKDNVVVLSSVAPKGQRSEPEGSYYTPGGGKAVCAPKGTTALPPPGMNGGLPKGDATLSPFGRTRGGTAKRT